MALVAQLLRVVQLKEEEVKCIHMFCTLNNVQLKEKSHRVE